MKYYYAVLFILLVEVFRSNAIIVRNTTTISIQPELYRLFKNVVLDTYNLQLIINDDLRTFSGSNVINMKTTETTNKFKLNYDKLRGLDDYDHFKIDEIDEHGKSKKSHYISKLSLCAVCGTFTLETMDDVPASTNIQLTITNFSGDLSNDFNGMYLTHTRDNMSLIATNFQPFYARKVFPCYDEPSFRAKVNFVITFPKDFGSCSFNSRLIKTTGSKNQATFTFDTTPVMPIHQLNIVLSQYQSVMKYYGARQISIYTRESGLCLTSYPLQEAVKIFKALYALAPTSLNIDGLVLFALPDIKAPISAGWGIITYPENFLLYSNSEHSTLHQQQIVGNIALSFAKMWLYNLLQIDWWTNVWLIETLSEYIANAIIREAYQEWNIPTFTYNNPETVNENLNAETEPLSVDVKSVFQPFDILKQFAPAKTNKGVGILCMIQNILGTGQTKDAVSDFLKEIKGKVDITAETFTTFLDKYPTPSLTGAAKLPENMSIILHNWIYSSGLPVLNINKQDKNILISQEQLILPDTYNDLTASTTTKWYVPISFTLLSNPDFNGDVPKVWLTPKASILIKNMLKDDDDSIIIDNQGMNLFTVNYDKPLLDNIMKVMKDEPDVIDETIRNQILINLITLSKTGSKTLDTALQLVEFLDKDTSFETWNLVLGSLEDTLTIIGMDTPTTDKVLDSLSGKITILVNSINFDDIGINPTMTEMQILAIEWGTKVNNPVVLEVVQKEFNKFENGGEIPRDIFEIVLVTALQKNPHNWFVIENRLKNTQDPEVIVDIIRALGATPVKTQLVYFLSKIVAPDTYINPQYNVEVIRSVLTGSPTGPDALLEFVVFSLKDIITVGIDVVHDIIMPLSETISTTEQFCLLNAIVCCDCNGLVVVTPEENDKIWKTISGNHLRKINLQMQAENYLS